MDRKDREIIMFAFTKKIISGILTLSMIGSFIPSVFAQEEAIEGSSTFDFDATNYSVGENDGEIKIKVMRHGGNAGEVDVSFKAADFLSEYGVDYEIISEDKTPFPKVFGEKPDPSEFVYDESSYNINTDSENESQPEQTAEPNTETDSNEASQIGNVSDTVPEKKNVSTGSSLLDAKAQYLNLPEGEDAEQTKSAVSETLNDMYTYFLSAQGSEGVVRFENGETEKDIIVKIYDNDLAESDKVFMLALMGTSTDNSSVSAAATTYVTITDDDEYETPYVELVEDSIDLTPDSPEGYVTVRRTNGTQYFTTVFLSTVTLTAKEGAYESFEEKTVAFVPGETEKSIKVSAYDFSENAAFGIRLEGDSTVETGSYYTNVNIRSNTPSETSEQSEQTIQLMDNTKAVNTVIGSETTEVFLNDISGGWNSDITKGKVDGRSTWIDGGYSGHPDLYLEEYTKNAGRSWITNKKQNLTAVRQINFHTSVGGDGSKFKTWFEIDNARRWDSSVESVSWTGKTNGWVSKSLNVSKDNDSYYFKFLTKPTASGKHNSKASLGNPLEYVWAKYTFSPQNSVENFNRKVYDFIEGTPNIYDIFYDGATDRVYNPGTISVKRSDNSNVTGFYPNSGETVTISAVKETNSANGIYLKGVYFAPADMSNGELYNDGYTNKNVYYVSANTSTRTVTIKPDQSFVKTLMNKGVLKTDNSNDSEIKIYPVFGVETVEVRFENADANGVFNETTKGSYINNVFGLTHKDSSVGDYYSIKVPKHSAIRVQMTAMSDKEPKGFLYYKTNYSSSGKNTYYKAGETIHSGTNTNGQTITETDYSKAEIIADSNITIKPVTSEQTFYVGYSPVSYSNRPVDSLENVVTDTTNGVIGDTTNKSGYMWLKNPFIGKNYTLTAIAPEGYYTSWANMTGDTNNNGQLGDDGDNINAGNTKTTTPMYVYGTKLNITLDQNDTRYYYYFVPKSNTASYQQTGYVSRDKSTLFQLANGIKENKQEPVAGAYMDIGGFTGMTDGNGRYSIEMNGLPDWGTVSATLSVGDVNYNATANIERSSKMILPALEVFNAKSVSAGYSGETLSRDQNNIMIEDGSLEINVSVENQSSIKPSNARFFIYNDSGYQTIDCSDIEQAEFYNTSVSASGDALIASLKFNPKKDMKFGYKVYVQFADQNGKWYNPIDVGYSFFAPLDLGTFTFSMIGSETLENQMETGFVADIIGNPLGDIDLGSISAFETETYSHTANVPESEKSQYTWPVTEYSFGGSTIFRGRSRTNSDKSYKNKMKDYLYKVQNDDFDGKAPTQSKFATKSMFRWSITPSVGFNLCVSNRSDGKVYFEDLAFCVKVDFDFKAMQKISLPLGFGLLVQGNLNGDIIGIYHMYTDYQDSYETEDAVEYSAETFGMFKDIDHTRREGYLFLDPSISVKLGIGWGGIIYITGTADFKFDMDFQFTESGAKSYGDITINLDWGIELLTFTVYSNRIWGDTFKLFNTEGQNGHINYDYESVLSSALMSVGDYMDIPEGEFVLDKPTSREYLKDGNEWNGGMSANLMSIDISGETTEQTLIKSPGNPQMRITKIDDNYLLGVFIMDNPNRDDINSRTLYYTIYNRSRSEWGFPKILEDDNTIDDYPNMQDLGNGKILVTWSSAEKVLTEGADVNEALGSLNIQAKIFDKNTREFGETYTLTKTTDKDKCADLMPKAAYDSATDKVILYYTKTEYNIKNPEDVANANSTIAYLFYDCKSDTWSNTGDVYTEEELSGLGDDAAKQEFREQWYGQRFLYLPLDGDKNNLPLVIDSDVIGYNGYSLFTWVIDWDQDMNTVYDRDVFMQIYNFAENKFTKIVRITSETGSYASPQFARSDNTTYLFYGAQAADEDHGYVKYLDISDIISNEKYKLTTNGQREYYELKYDCPSFEYITQSGETKTTDAYTITIDGAKAVEMDNTGDFDVFVDNDGLIYLFWTEGVGDSRHIFASMYNGSDAEDDENEASWSEPFVLTHKTKMTYSDVNGAVINGTIFITSEQTDDLTSKRMIVVERHTPTAKLTVADISLDKENPIEGQAVKVTATLKNEGMLPVSAESNTGVSFKLNGTEFALEGAGYEIPGGATQEVSVYINLPENSGKSEFSAAVGEGTPVTKEVQLSPQLSVSDDSIIYYSAESPYGEGFTYTSSIENTGNADSGAVTFTAYVNETEAGTKTVDIVKYGEAVDIDLPLNIDDSAYTVKDGIGTANVIVKAIAADGSEISVFDETVQKEFDAEAVKLLNAVTDVTFEKDYSVKVGGEINIQPVINGVEENRLRVEWLSSDSDNVSINDSNRIVANKVGSATLTGVVVPSEEIISFDSLGNVVKTDWKELIPSNMLKTVTAQINVADTHRIAYNTEDGSADAYSPTEGKYSVIFAAYKDGVLHSVKEVEVTFENAGSQTVKKPDGFEDSNADMVNVFFWDSISNMTPLCPAG